jgi:hypothetical protein
MEEEPEGGAHLLQARGHLASAFFAGVGCDREERRLDLDPFLRGGSRRRSEGKLAARAKRLSMPVHVRGEC